jgi:hypothetical protein
MNFDLTARCVLLLLWGTGIVTVASALGFRL